MKKIRFRESLLPFGIILCAALWIISGNISRPLWFDEVITTTGFAINLDFSQIYLRYNIPNNHILFTYLLKAFINTWSAGLNVMEWTFRLPSIFISLISLWFLFDFIRKKAGKETALAATILFALSMPFAIYSVAIRGYMMSFLFILLSFIYCEKALRKKSRSSFILYFVFSLLAVGTIPSNIAMLLPIPFIAARYRKIKDLFKIPFIITILLPIIAITAFYLPIHEKFIANMKLKEGWTDNLYAAIAVYTPFAVSFLPLLVSAVPCVARRKILRIDILARIAVFFIPAAVCSIGDIAPFPRVFFSLWALWIPLAASAAGPLLRKTFRKFKSDLRLLLIVAAAVFWPLACMTGIKDFLSCRTADGKGMDDYFYPYYLHGDFDPLATAKILKQVSAGENVPIYASFDADPYALGFYCSLVKIPDSLFLFDGPVRKITSIKSPDSPYTLIAVKDEKELDQIRKRFPFRNLHPIDTTHYQKIYAVTPE